MISSKVHLYCLICGCLVPSCPSVRWVFMRRLEFRMRKLCQICPGLSADEILIPYDKHHKVSSWAKGHQNTLNSVKNEVIWKCQLTLPNMKYQLNHTCIQSWTNEFHNLWVADVIFTICNPNLANCRSSIKKDFFQTILCLI